MRQGPTKPIAVENYHLSISTHEQALQAAGFGQIRWHRPCVSPLGLASHPAGFWSIFLDFPPVILLECAK
jgi:hypothetical protein